MNNKTIIKIRLILWSGLGLVVVWLLWQAVVPTGRISYVYDFKHPSYFIGHLRPKDRVEPPENGRQKIIGDPVYFNLRPPRQFNKVKVILKYRRISDDEKEKTAPILEIGVLADKTVWRYDLKPLDNEIINELAREWNAVRGQNNVILLEKEKKYASVEEFLANLPPRNEIALYHYNLSKEFVLPDYASSSKERIINYALRGPYQFYTYLGDNENLDFTFYFRDLNKNKDKDPIELQLYCQGELIDSRRLPDNNDIGDSGQSEDRGQLQLKLSGLPAGIYKVELRVNDDIITKKITTKQSKLAFVHQLWLYRAGASDIKLYTDSRRIQAKTPNPDSLQVIKVGQDELELNKTYKQFSILVRRASSTAGYSIIKLAKDGVILAGDEVFAFSPSALLNPDFRKVDIDFDVQAEGINYILARYQWPLEVGEWRTANAEFELRRAYRENGQYSFLISIPGLRADDEVSDGIEISEIKVELLGKNLIEKIKELFL